MYCVVICTYVRTHCVHTYLPHLMFSPTQGGTAAPNFLTENEVYARVSDLFKDEDDLLAEFGQFLPDCTAHFSGMPPVRVCVCTLLFTVLSLCCVEFAAQPDCTHA